VPSGTRRYKKHIALPVSSFVVARKEALLHFEEEEGLIYKPGIGD